MKKLLLISFIFGAILSTGLSKVSLVTMCFRNRTIQVPNYLIDIYFRSGATLGPCKASPQ